MSKDQLDLFQMPPPGAALAGSKDEFQTDIWKPKAGAPEYMAAQELVHFVSYLKLNDWQKKVLWPHLRYIIDERMTKSEDVDLRFELGYLIGSMEVEQVRSRSDARGICLKYGVKI